MSSSPSGVARLRWTVLIATLAVVLGLVPLYVTNNRSVVPLPGLTDTAKAALAAKQSNQSVLVASAVSETSETVANPDGTFATTTHTQPVRVRRNGRWIPADDRLTRQADGTWAQNGGVAETTLSGRRAGAGKPLLQLAKDGLGTGLDWLGDLPEPVVTGSTATYPEVLPGVDLVVETTVDTAYQVVVVKTPEAAQHVASLTFGLPSNGLTVTKADDGSLHARDAKGDDVFVAKVPRMWDSSGIAPAETDLVRGPAAGGRSAAVATTLAGDRLTLEPDQGLLAAKDARYPLYVDPTWHENYCANCNRNHYLVQYACGSGKRPADALWDSDTEMRVGFYGDGTSSCEQHLVTARSFVEMNLGGLGGKQIISSAFNLNTNNSSICADDAVNNLHLTNVIGNGLKFGSGPAVYDYLGTIPKCTTNVEFDVTGLITRMVKANAPTVTLGILSPDENNTHTWKRYSTQVGFTVVYNSQPNPVKNLQIYNGTQGYPCAQGSDRPVLGRTSTHYIAKANVSDPDGGMLWGGFRTYRIGPKGSYNWDGAEAAMDNVPSDTNQAHQNAHVELYSRSLTADGLYAVDVRASDGKADAPPTKKCEFELELSAPTGPTITSDVYPADAWGGGPGQAGQFTFTVANSPTSVDHYVWRLDNTTAAPTCGAGELGSIPARGFNGPGVATIAPSTKGTHVLSVWSCNRARTASSRVDYGFNVNDATGPVGSWQFEGDYTSANPVMRYAGEGTGIFTDGRVDAAVTLSGATGDYLATPIKVVGTTGSYSVSAWARLADVAGDHVVVSQDGASRSGFSLRYDKALGRWAFGVAAADNASATVGNATSSAAPVVGEWTHLIGAYDATAHTVALYVNGQAQSTAPVTGFLAQGPFLIGAGKLNGTRNGLYTGAIDEVAVYRRALSAADVTTLTANNGVPTGLTPFREYKLDEQTTDATGTENSLTRLGAPALGQGYSDSPGSSATERQVGKDAGQGVVLNRSSNVQTDVPLIETTRSYTVSAWVKLTDLAGDYAVAAQDGARATPFQLRFSASAKRWQMGLSTADSETETYRWATSTSVPQAGVWTHLTGAYDPTNAKALLYVNGVLEAQVAIPTGTVWPAYGRFTIGRAVSAATTVELFYGTIDQVQVWDRTLGAAEIAGLARTPVLRANYQLSNGDGSTVPAVAAWNMDETSGTTAADSSGNNNPLTLTGGTAWTAGKSGNAVRLDGTGAGQAAGPVIDTSQGFAVSAWVDLADTAGSYMVASVSGDHASSFTMGYAADVNRWVAGMSSADADGDTNRWAAATTTPKAGVWTQLSAVYDTDANTLTLYVNGVQEARVAIPEGTAWEATGPFEVGRYRRDSAAAASFNGLVDQVRVIGQTITEDQAAALAGVTRDGVTRAVAVPSGGAALANTGGVNVARFDSSGTGQFAGPRPPVLRTDGSYTIEAWVRHTWTDQDVAAAKQADPANTNGIDKATRTALGLKDPQFSPFDLGYRGEKDASGTLRRRWAMTVVQQDTTMATPHAMGAYIEGAQDNVWTHLVGTYDAATRTQCLYASTDTKDFTPVCVADAGSWAGSDQLANLLVGRGVWLGQPSDMWYGDLRGIRVYSGVVDSPQMTVDARVDHP